MPSIRTSIRKDKPSSYISLKRRFFSFLIDIGIIAILIKLTYSNVVLPPLGLDSYAWGFAALYFIALTSSPLHSTIGQLLLDMKVTNSEGSRPRIWQSFRRVAMLLVGIIISVIVAIYSEAEVGYSNKDKKSESSELCEFWDWICLKISNTKLVRRSV
jgi:uncharacterized RDD family membrane protein YckC